MYSALPVAQELAGRGDEVVFYATEQFAPEVHTVGAQFRPLGPALVGLYDELAAGGANVADVGKIVRSLGPYAARLLVEGLRAVPGMVERVRAERADRIVYNTMCPWGLALARMLDLPAVTMSTSFVMKPGSDFEQMLAMAVPDAMDDMMTAVDDEIDELHIRHGIPRLRLSDMIAPEEDLNLVPIIRQFQPGADSLDQRYLFLGPSIRPRGDRGDFPLNRLAAPVLYVSLGTRTSDGVGERFARLCFEAFAGSRWQVVLATGAVNRRPLGPIPDNFVIRSFVPQLEVLELADVFVTHGGANSVQESIWYGVPMVGIPQTIEQYVNTGRAAELGLGLRLVSAAVTANGLRNAVHAVDTDPGYRRRLAVVSAKSRAAGGYRRAADAIQGARSNRRQAADAHQRASAR